MASTVAGLEKDSHTEPIIESKRYPNYLEFFGPQTEKVTHTYFPENGQGIILLNHKGLKSPQDFTTARIFLHNEAGIADNELDAVFTQDGKLKPIQDDGINPYDLSPFALTEYLREKVLPIYNLVSRSLDASLPNGFNRHDIEHIDRNIERGIKFLYDTQDGSKPDLDTLQVFIAATIGHDLGNLLSRTHHPELSLKLLEHFVPSLKRDPQKWQRIQEAILLHDEPKLKQLILYIWQTGEETIDEVTGKKHFSMNIAETSKVMRETMRQEVNALIAADKFDFGRSRVSDGKHDLIHLENDRHTRVNMMMDTTQAERNGDTFVLELTYNQYLSPDEEKRFESLIHVGRRGNRILVPLEMHTAQKQNSVPHSVFIEEDFWDIYEDRLPISMAATNAIYSPGTLTSFVVRVIDPKLPLHKYDPRIAQRERIFSFIDNRFLEDPIAA